MRLGISLVTFVVAAILGAIVALAASTSDSAARAATTSEFVVRCVGCECDDRIGLGVVRESIVGPPVRDRVAADLVPEIAPIAEIGRPILLTGHVADVESGASASGIRLSLLVGNRMLGAPVVVGEGGAFSFSLDEACVDALREAPRFEILAESSDATADRVHLATRTRLRTERAIRGAPIEVGVVRARTIEGRLLDAFGLPVRFAYLEVAPPSCAGWASLAAEWERRVGFGDEEGVFLCDGERSTARTDVDGRFRIGSLTPIGVAECVVLPTPTSADCPRIGFDISSAVVDERRDLDLVLPDPSTSIEGRILVDGLPSRGMVLWCDGRLRGEISTDGDGWYRIAGVDPGAVEIRAVVRSGGSSRVRSLELARGERRDLDLEIVATSP